jgi:uncharacterized phage protein gp47/JayE
MQLPLQSFATLVQNMAAAVQSAATQLLDLTVGSTLRAVLEANASIGLWMQWLMLRLLQTTRAATSTAADLDTWMADFAFYRLPAAPATGVVTFSRFTPTSSAFIPTGSLVRTADGTQTFVVSASLSNPGYNAQQNGYTILPGVASLDVPVVSLVPGAAGNVQSSSITLMANAVAGVDMVVNAAAFLNGLDAETDSAFRVRFSNYFDSRSRATPLAVGSAIANIQQNLVFTIQENIDPSGSPRIGRFVVTLDDGSGSPSAALMLAASAAIDAVRPIGSTFTVQPPTIMTANVTASINTNSAAGHASAAANATRAIVDYINGLAIGNTLSLTKIAQLAYQADPSIVNVTQIELNAATADITPPVSGVVKSGTVAVN